MPQLRRDPVGGYWVAFSEERRHRPLDFPPEPISHSRVAREDCPFCPGNEAQTPPAVLTFLDEAGRWRLRTVPNKYPALDGNGSHEVIIDAPLHTRSFGELPEAAAIDLLSAARDRFEAFHSDRRIEYVQLFKNNGPGSGASLEHPHSQLLALPFIPVQLLVELNNCEAHFSAVKRCLFCDLIEGSEDRLVWVDEFAVAIAPYAPRFAFETWIFPRRHYSRFEESDEATMQAVARMLHRLARRIEALRDLPPYNFFLHSGPWRPGQLDHFHWHLEFLPRLSGVGGYEFGTGCYINTTLPENAARQLRAD